MDKDERQLYKNRKSYNHAAKHAHDNLKNMGYNYKGKLYKNTTSDELWANPMQNLMILKLETLLNFSINEVKKIKKTFSIAHDKDSTNIN